MIRRLFVLLFFCPLPWAWAQSERCPVDIESDLSAPRAWFLDQLADTLRHDNNVPHFVFRFPDAFGDDFRNQRFRATEAAMLTGALFVFPTRSGVQWTSGDPDLVTMVWASSSDSLPDANQVLLRDTLDFGEFSSHIFSLDSAWHDAPSQVVFVDLSAYGLALDSGDMFHLGYTAVFDSPDDSLAILSDAGETETNWASEYYDGSFHLIRSGWRGVNFFIRVIVESASGSEILSPSPRDIELLSAYPNPFNAETRINYVVPQTGNVRLDVFDVNGRFVGSPMNGVLAAGNYSMSLSASDWSSGIYWVRVQSPAQQNVIKLVLEK